MIHTRRYVGFLPGVLIVAIAFLALPELCAGVNFLPNHSFEMPDDRFYTLPQSWRPIENPPPASVVHLNRPELARTGRRCVMLHRTFLRCSQSVPVQANNKYVMSVYARVGLHEVLAGDEKVVLRAIGPGVDYYHESPRLTQRYRRFQMVIQPRRTGRVTFSIGAIGSAVMIDDVQVEPGEVAGKVAPQITAVEDPLPIAFNPFLSSEILNRDPSLLEQADAVIDGGESVDETKLRFLADACYNMRDDFRAGELYKTLKKNQSAASSGALIDRRLRQLEDVLARRRQRTDLHLRKVIAAHDVWQHPLPAAANQIYYYPWESLVYLTVVNADQRFVGKILTASITDLHANVVLRTQPFTLQSNAKSTTITIPLTGITPDKIPSRRYRLTVHEKGRPNTIVFAQSFGVIAFPHEPLMPIHEIGIRRDGALMINHQPFLMLGIWDSFFRRPFLQERLIEMASCGFNKGPGNPHAWHPSMYFFIAPQAGSYHQAGEPALPTNWAGHPNALGWFWWDEPFYMLREPEHSQYPDSWRKIHEMYRWLRLMKPFKPVMVNGLNRAEHFLPYIDATDIAMTEPYSVGRHGIMHSAQSVKQAIAQADHPVCPGVIFGVHGRPAVAAPVVRSEFYTAVLSGFKAFYWFSYDFEGYKQGPGASEEDYIATLAPLTWSAFRGLTREAKLLAPFILSRESSQLMTVSPPRTVTARLFRNGDQAVVIAVGTHCPQVLGKWRFARIENTTAHRGTWEAPTKTAPFIDRNELPASAGKAAHGIIAMEPVILHDNDTIRQQIRLEGSADKVVLRFTADDFAGDVWIRPSIIAATKQFDVSRLEKGRWHQLDISIKEANLAGKLLTGVYFDTDSPHVWWGPTLLVRRGGKPRVWFNQDTYRYALATEQMAQASYRPPDTEFNPPPPEDSPQVTIHLPEKLSIRGGRVLFEPAADPRISETAVTDRLGPGSARVYRLLLTATSAEQGRTDHQEF